MRTKLSQFKFELPEELIAQYPSDVRDESRLMVVHRDTGKIEHKLFKDLIDYFEEDDALIFNMRMDYHSLRGLSLSTRNSCLHNLRRVCC